MREWLIALGILVIVAVLLDGVRRMRTARRDSIQLANDMNRGLDRTGLDLFDGEQSIGAARVVAHRHASEDEPDFVDDEMVPFADTGRRQSLNLTQPVPLLMDDVNDVQQRIEPGFGREMDSASADDILSGDAGKDALNRDIKESLSTVRAAVTPDVQKRQPFASAAVTAATASAGATVSSSRPVLDSATTPLIAGESDILSPPRVYERPADRPPPRREPPVIKQSKPVVKAQQERAMKIQQQEQQQQKASPQLPLEDIIIINVMARDRSRFSGAALLEILLANGLRYGHHNIFHCYTGEDREEESLYSVVNAVKPGTFDLNQMDTFNTPGIGLFLRLPTPGRAMDAFDSMLKTARSIADTLNGELRDENRSVMTAQTIEHCRQRIRDFEMQSRLRAR